MLLWWLPWQHCNAPRLDAQSIGLAFRAGPELTLVPRATIQPERDRDQLGSLRKVFMTDTTLEHWHVACRDEPIVPPASPHVSFVVHRKGAELFQLGAEVSGLAPSAVVTVSARVLDRGNVRRFAMALAEATAGAVLADGPILWTLRIKREQIPNIEDAWTALTRDAEEATAALARHVAEWTPDPADDWADV
jgi:hypothetical protein